MACEGSRDADHHPHREHRAGDPEQPRVPRQLYAEPPARVDPPPQRPSAPGEQGIYMHHELVRARRRPARRQAPRRPPPDPATQTRRRPRRPTPRPARLRARVLRFAVSRPAERESAGSRRPAGFSRPASPCAGGEAPRGTAHPPRRRPVRPAPRVLPAPARDAPRLSSRPRREQRRTASPGRCASSRCPRSAPAQRPARRARTRSRRTDPDRGAARLAAQPGRRRRRAAPHNRRPPGARKGRRGAALPCARPLEAQLRFCRSSGLLTRTPCRRPTNRSSQLRPSQASPA